MLCKKWFVLYLYELNELIFHLCWSLGSPVLGLCFSLIISCQYQQKAHEPRLFQCISQTTLTKLKFHFWLMSDIWSCPRSSHWKSWSCNPALMIFFCLPAQSLLTLSLLSTSQAHSSCMDHSAVGAWQPLETHLLYPLGPWPSGAAPSLMGSFAAGFRLREFHWNETFHYLSISSALRIMHPIYQLNEQVNLPFNEYLWSWQIFK